MFSLLHPKHTQAVRNVTLRMMSPLSSRTDTGTEFSLRRTKGCEGGEPHNDASKELSGTRWSRRCYHQHEVRHGYDFHQVLHAHQLHTWLHLLVAAPEDDGCSHLLCNSGAPGHQLGKASDESLINLYVPCNGSMCLHGFHKQLTMSPTFSTLPRCTSTSPHLSSYKSINLFIIGHFAEFHTGVVFMCIL